ncbi:hypothetical protein Ahy_B07g086988 [Arachis hypogaea]|uniref:Uncharacterized protein n=1 Tax=Arachis hypogaea TaxID=3818 RepID=A0A444YB05_ARAHY|nr:hypothetical protein Ahy_B07g086988 [Arachis hypogaea]
MISRKYCWVIKRYNGSHTSTKATISQDHSKLDSNTIAEAIKPLVEADPSIKVKSIIAKVQSKFNYTISYRKAWLAKKKLVEKIFESWKASYETLPIWFEAMLMSKVFKELVGSYHESINAAVARSNGAWSPPRTFYMYIESNFLRKFKVPYLQKLVVNIDNVEYVETQNL